MDLGMPDGIHEKTLSKTGKPRGWPRKTPEGGKSVLFYLPKTVIEYIKSQGGSSWIRRKALEEMKTPGKEEGGKKNAD